MKIENSVQKTETVTVTLTANDIIDLFQSKYGDKFERMKNPQVTFNVPGGGDYSNCTIEIDRENPIKLVFGVS